MRRSLLSVKSTTLLVTAVAGLALLTIPGQASAKAPAHRPSGTAGNCSPRASALSYTDALDKFVHEGTAVGGLSNLAYDRRAQAWASTVDNHANDPARIWFISDLKHPTVTRPALVLKNPDGVPYDGTTADNEGLVVLPNGDYVISSEAEPTIRVFGRDGVQKQSLPVPARFTVTGKTPEGEATSNATLEGLTLTPSGRRLIASMEGALSGDTSVSDATGHRFLVYDLGADSQWRLTKQLAYRTQPGQRIAEVLAYRDDALLIEEASYDAATGNAVSLYATPRIGKGQDVSTVANLSTLGEGAFLAKTFVVDVVACPTLGATAKQAQTNPLLDNYEGMALSEPNGRGSAVTGVTLVSDDNFGASQITRFLNLGLRLP